jgi:pimeloyl-ACP methyl ester carboxylesterase
MKEIYLLSGLGADKRVFDFLDLSNHKLNHINWIDPLPDESIDSYAQKLTAQILTSKPILIGVSFGGIIAIEIGKLIKTEKVILISSAVTRNDIPFYYRFVGLLKLHKIIPSAALKNVNAITYWFFGIRDQKEKELLRAIIKETDQHFLKWAIQKIVNWQNKETLKNVIHIHGTSDRILPVSKPDYKIQNGGHLMIVNKSHEVGELLNKLLA